MKTNVAIAITAVAISAASAAVMIWSPGHRPAPRVVPGTPCIPLPATQSGYTVCPTDQGAVLLRLKEAAPYLGGFRLKLMVGNTLSATISRLDLDLFWGAKTSNEPIIEECKPGEWTPVEVIISPATTEELKGLCVRAGISQVSMRERP